MFRPPPVWGAFTFLLVAISIAIAVYALTLRDGYGALAERAQVRLSQHNDKFLGQISRFQQLASTMSRHPTLRAAVELRDGTGLEDLLLSFALSTGSAEIYLVDADGTLLATSETARNGSLEPRRLEFEALGHIRTALNGSLGWSHGLEATRDQRSLYFAGAIFADDGPVIGAVAVSVTVGALEFEWSFSPEPVAYFDQAGVVFVTNRPGLALLVVPEFASESRTQFDTNDMSRILTYEDVTLLGHRIWRNVDSRLLPEEVLILDQYLPRIGMTGMIFQDVRPVQERAALFGAVAALAMALLGLLIWGAWIRRQSLARQLQSEEAANVALEARVAVRTAELHDTQQQLIAASRLSALGEMSAGISHELSQPLGAIRNYAENGKKLIGLGKSNRAVENFELQMGQIDRISRIIKSLRAFAHNEGQDTNTIDIAHVVDEALAVSDMRLGREGVSVERLGFEEDIFVRAGHVRLQQVLVNILGNAMDAMAASKQKLIIMSLSASGNAVALCIADTGVGISDPEKVFDPFYSTKNQGGSSGMGLGLSISHGIIGTFGGTLTCRNTSSGGGEFIITLPLAEPVS